MRSLPFIVRLLGIILIHDVIDGRPSNTVPAGKPEPPLGPLGGCNGRRVMSLHRDNRGRMRRLAGQTAIKGKESK